MVPTKRTYGLLVAGGLVATAIASFGNSLVGAEVSAASSRFTFALFALVCFDGAVLAAAFWDSFNVKKRRVSISRLPLHRLSIGRDNPVELKISAEGPAHLLIYDQPPVEFNSEFDGADLPLRTQVMEKGEQSLTYTVNPKHRGDYQWGDIEVRQRGPWNLGWSSWKISAAESVAVYPDLIGLRQLTIRLALQSTGTLKQRRKLGVGTEFAELREYDIGDDPRFIDWKATARKNQPLVRVLEPEREQTLIILLDRGRLMTAKVKGLTRFDWGLNATLALALAGIQRGDRVGIGIFDRTMHTWMPPKRGQPYLRQMIEQLTPIQPELVESDYLGAVTQVVRAQNRRALVVALTDVVDQTASAELLGALIRLRPRYLPFCVTLRDPQIDVQAASIQPNIAGAYEKAVAIDLIAQRQAALSKLKKSGVMVLDAPANAITDSLVDSYLRIKARAQL